MNRIDSSKIEQWVTRHWYSPKKTWLAYLLFPAAKIFSSIVWARRILYKKGYLKSYRAPCPVVVVGNITVGGVGKTPLVIALYFFLKERGWAPGIISRGYKGEYSKEKKFVWVKADSDPRQVGDEAVLLATKTDAPIIVARDRALAIQKLMQKSCCNIILSDDGLQHYAIARDVEIVVLDENRKFGNALCLPAGPLREPISRLKEINILVVNGDDESQCAFSLVGENLINLFDERKRESVHILKNKKIHAIAGIGFPERFFNDLRKLGAEVVAHAFADHYVFQASDFQWVAQDDMIVMTEKDAVKCRSFAKQNFWFLPVHAQFNALLTQSLETDLQKISRKNE